ncbi:hypothetical protein C8R43DRAFT_1117791 [Mycena crocata]|nr:hypothetical protein C8R43DRAFT_1117791 [Mycena crocata]
MSKRSLSPSPLQPSKRLHTLSGAAPLISRLTFDNALYEELILLIFANLSWIDLCTASQVNKNWARLSLDNGLWKERYLEVFGRSRLRGAKGFIGRTDGREVKRLPGRAKTSKAENKDWRWMFRISWNWKRGRCTTERVEGILNPSSGSTPDFVALAGSLTIIASSEASANPEVHCLHSTSGSRETLLCGSPRHKSSHITALALDQSPPSSGILQLAVFLSTGEFIIFSIQQQLNPSASSRKFTYLPLRVNTRTAPIIQAVYHHPLLISLSESFSLSLYDLSSDTVTHTQTLTAYTTFPPSSLILSSQTPGDRYKLVLTYAVPIFPVHFSIGVTELIISGTSSSSSSLSSGSSVGLMSVVSTRTEQWGRKLLRIQDTQSDGKWVVLAPGEAPSQGRSGATAPYQLSGDSPASLQLYRLFLPLATSVASPRPHLSFVRFLHHTAGAVSSMALADGRCVTLGKNGGIWVWDLESGTGAEVAPPSRSGDPELDSVEKGTVVFDDRRIITARAGILSVHRFDV